MRRVYAFLVDNWALKLTALVFAVLFWYANKTEEQDDVDLGRIPVSVELVPEGWTLAQPPSPDTVSVSFTGPTGDLFGIARNKPRIVIPVREVLDTVTTVRLDPAYLTYPSGSGGPGMAQARAIRPSVVTLVFERVVTESRPVSITTRGDLPDHLEFDAPPTVRPSTVDVNGPSGEVESLDSMRLVPLDLRDITEPSVLVRTVAIDTTGLSELSIQPRRVEVRMSVSLREPEPDEEPDEDGSESGGDGDAEDSGS